MILQLLSTCWDLLKIIIAFQLWLTLLVVIMISCHSLRWIWLMLMYLKLIHFAIHHTLWYQLIVLLVDYLWVQFVPMSLWNHRARKLPLFTLSHLRYLEIFRLLLICSIWCRLLGQLLHQLVFTFVKERLLFQMELNCLRTLKILEIKRLLFDSEVFNQLGFQIVSFWSIGRFLIHIILIA